MANPYPHFNTTMRYGNWTGKNWSAARVIEAWK